MSLPALDAWIPDPEDNAVLGQDSSPLANWHYLRGALRRGRRIWLTATLLGLAAALTALVMVPAPHRASTLLVLAHDPLVDPGRAMETDVSLAGTITVAERTIEALGLRLTPEDLQESVEVTPGSADSLLLRVTASSDAEAVARLRAYTEAFLAIRSEQVTAQSLAVAAGSKARIRMLEAEVAELTRRMDALTAGGEAGADLLGDVLTQRAQLIAQVNTVQQTLQDAELRASSVTSASRVVDAARAEPRGVLRRAVTLLGSGLIVGGALGAAAVLLRALTSNRLRRRDEVAFALGTRVTASVGRLSRVGLRRMVRIGSAERTRRETDRRRLAQALERGLPAAGWRQRLVVGCLDNSREVSLAVVELAASLLARGRGVHLVDLTEAGRVDRAVAEVIGAMGKDAAEGGPTLTVHRPAAIPSLSRGPIELVARAVDSGTPENADARVGAGTGTSLGLTAGNDVVLVVADLHPAMGGDHLLAWGPRVVVAVTGGRSSAERVQATAEMLRECRLEICGAVLLHDDPTDESAGQAPGQRTGPER